jgi:chromosome segregation ATPase
MEVEQQDHDLASYRTQHDLLEDQMMDVEMSVKGAHTMIVSMKDEVRDLDDSMANIHNQVESIQVEDIAWCRSRISTLEKPNNPTNSSLWQLVNRLSRWVEDQEDLIKGLQAGLVGAKDWVGVLEMLSSMICSRVQVLEEAMEIDPPVTDLSGEDSTDS